jgi:uncharacterized 2Fe-2S/4Fe-4S cluster protein (DUF4445 family)
MFEPDPLVVFQPSGKRGHFPRGTPVLAAARDLGVQIESVCGGRGVCGRCQVEVAEGEFSKLGITSNAMRLSAPDFLEERYDRIRGLPEERRLSCAAHILGDVVIDVPESSIIGGAAVRKDATTHGLDRNPALRLAYVELAEPDLETQLGDADRLIAALEQSFKLTNVHIPFATLGKVQSVLREGGWKATAVIDSAGARPEVIALFPGFHETLCGLAVDIGSTTIAAHLVDLMDGEILASAGRANPQIRFGEDLMSRVSYVMMNANGRENLTAAVRTAVNELIDQLIEKAAAKKPGADIRAALLEAVFVANPVMHHLFLGLDPTPLGQAPFNPAVSDAIRLGASEIGVRLGEGGRIYLLPIIAGHVGADAAAVLLAEKLDKASGRVLAVDVGTNAEIMLAYNREIYAASSPTGPAFEGAEISSGQRAAPGAIERIRIDKQTLAPRYRIIGSRHWSDEPEFAGATAQTGVTGICGSGIIEVIGEMVIAGILTTDGIIRAPETPEEEARLVQNGRTWSYVVQNANPRLLVTQNDVRAIQLAKAALYAGVKLLMDRARITTVDEIRLAGAFGSYIDPTYAMLLGLVPDCAAENVRAVGNAAGQGALVALLDVAARQRIEDIVRKVIKVETALEPGFQDHFVNAMAMPNAVDPFMQTKMLFKMDLTMPSAGGPQRTGARRRNMEGGDGPGA